MNLHQISFEDTHRFSSTFLNYLQQNPSLASFVDLQPSLSGFEKKIRERQLDPERRHLLAGVISKQYEKVGESDAVNQNIELLKEDNTFTVTTGHQLNILTGPLFFIYKIVSTIKLCSTLKEQHPDFNFVPIYWMASEDHDFEEISTFRLFGKKYTWQDKKSGPVGKVDTSSLAEMLSAMPDIPRFVVDAYQNEDNLAEANRLIVHHLFGQYGLLILDADNAKLKGSCREMFQDELFERKTNELVNSSTADLESKGFSGQIFPREINLFYLDNQTRERIVYSGDKFKVLNTGLEFSRDEILELLNTSPEKFSPNVVLRPVYQEMILPNLAYVGGPAEMTYWMQLKQVFDHFHVSFPILVPRLCCMIIPRAVSRKIKKNELNLKDLFIDFNSLKDQILSGDEESQFELSQEYNELANLFTSIRSRAVAVDGSLEGFVNAEHKRTEKILDNIGKRIKKSQEQKHSIAINQVQSILEKLFPDGVLQEREDNFLNFYINDPGFIDELIDKLDPLDFRFNIFTEDA